MTRADVMDALVGELLDMLSCYYIANGLAVEVHPRRAMDYDEAIALR